MQLVLHFMISKVKFLLKMFDMRVDVSRDRNHLPNIRVTR